jgi:glycosyltransferase involved in cell wall biosynthesis
MNSDYPQISVVAPAYRCSECLAELYRRLRVTLEAHGLSFEIIFVNDCSPDCDWEIIQDLARADKRVKGINLARNFGQHRAILAGVDHAAGEWTVVMDCDLQDQPEEIPKLYAKVRDEGCDIVFGRRIERKDSALKVLMSRLFNLLYNFLSDIRIDPTICNFSIAGRKVMDTYRRLRECNRSHGLTLLWCGFKVGYVDVDHAERFAGKTTYTLARSITLAIESITAQSNKPLRMSIRAGFIMSGLSFLYAIYRIIRYMIWGVQVSGWTTVIVSIYFIGGLLMANLGVIGLYLGKVFDETKGRPIYVAKDKVNFEPPG